MSLQAQLRAHTVDRRYVAVVEGNLDGDKGTFEWPILEEGERRKRVAREGETGIKAITDWKVLERFGIATLVEARLRTGRTHQIRIHFSHAGHPLVGDQVYRDLEEAGVPDPFQEAGAPRRTPRVGEARRRKGVGHDAASEGLRGAPLRPAETQGEGREQGEAVASEASSRGASACRRPYWRGKASRQ